MKPVVIMPIPMEQPRLRTGGLARRRVQEKEAGLQFWQAHLKIVVPFRVHNPITLLHMFTSVNGTMDLRVIHSQSSPGCL